MTLSIIVPVALLSLFPHQEPRFLIPILLPLVYLHGMTILPEAEQTLIEAAKNQHFGDRKPKQTSYTFLRFWLFTNMLVVIFYGFIHQGGVFQSTSYLYQDLKVTPLNVKYYIVTSYMYSLPESFLMQLPSDKMLTKGKRRYKVDRRVHLFEEGSKNVTYISQKLSDIVKNVGDHKSNVYLLLAGSLSDEFEYSAKKYKLKSELQNTFFPHLSLEAFPNLFMYCTEILELFYIRDCEVVPFSKYISYIFDMFKLKLYKITR